LNLTEYELLAKLEFKDMRVLMDRKMRQHHNNFVEEFKKTGEYMIFNRKLNHFLVKRNGFITPVSLQIMHSYSKIFDYTYLAFVT